MVWMFKYSNILSHFYIQDHSIPEDPEDGTARHRSGTLRDFLRAALVENSKSLNGLDFPGVRSGDVSLPYASDFIAWNQVQGEEFCHDDYPAARVRWGLCAMAGAYHRTHCDCEGFGTFVSPESGVKIWIIGVPKKGQDFSNFAYTGLFLSPYNSQNTNTELFDWVALVLKPGMTL